MKLAKTLLFATMLVGMSAQANAKAVDKNCANQNKGSFNNAVGLGKYAHIFGPTASPSSTNKPVPPPKTGT